MRHLSAAIALSLLFARDPVDGTPRAVDEWRRLFARPDAPLDAADEPVRSIGARVADRLAARRAARLSGSAS